ncbi:hypothetical protein L204_106058 [Cryptococcus depauperatus]
MAQGADSGESGESGQAAFMGEMETGLSDDSRGEVKTPVSALSTKTSDQSFVGSSSATTSSPRYNMNTPPLKSVAEFPCPTEHRDPPPEIPFSPSPTNSPNTLSLSAFPLRCPLPSSSNSPWNALASTSGLPTPSIEGPVGRNSPHLGRPFERLNIGSSNTATSPSQDTTPPVGGNDEPSPARGLSKETLMRYKAIATSANKPLENGNDTRVTFPEPLSTNRRQGSLPISFMPKHSSTATLHSMKSLSPLVPLGRSQSLSPNPSASQTQILLKAATPAQLSALLSKSSTLILDVRPPSSFQISHIPSSHSLPIPSTLLRRPAFTLSKLTPMLVPSSMRQVSEWRQKNDIVLIDADSGNVPVGGVLEGVAGKFLREGYEGNLWFVKGGHAAIKSNGTIPLVSDEDKEERQFQDGDTRTDSQQGLMGGRLASSAFSQESTGGGSKSQRQRPPRGLTMPATPSLSFQSNPFGSNLVLGTTAIKHPAVSKEFGSSTTTSNNDDFRRTKMQPANPFFDNIRQNLELCHGDVTERIPLNLPNHIHQRADQFPNWLKELVRMPEKDSMEELAKQFYELELHEQKRLQAVMEWHARESGDIVQESKSYGAQPPKGRQEGKGWDWAVQRKSDMEELQRLMKSEGIENNKHFPFSITAGVERGTKNRYKNIWPYDFSRVRLESPPDKDSDYINASFVQPLGTSRRYIATQGPLDATYRDFWTLIWEQNVRVIVMITKQYEGGLLKCGKYWAEQTYGPFTLKLIRQTGGEDKAAPVTSAGFDFGFAASTPRTPTFSGDGEKNIKRVFSLYRNDKPNESPRTIAQIQCVGWPDFDVPETPDTLLNLIEEVNQTITEVNPDKTNTKADEPPIVVHCSAGVGRTGSFIVVDAVLDGLRSEMFGQHPSGQSLTSGLHDPKATPRYSQSVPALGQLSSNPQVTSSTPSLSMRSALSEPTIAMQYTASPGPINTGIDDQFNSNLTFPDLQQPRKDSMEVDQPKVKNHHDKDLDSQGRFIEDTSAHGDDNLKRPSFASTHNISDKLSAESNLKRDFGEANPTARSNVHRKPSSLSQMDKPVPCVLEGMRVQRMSLVQTLRQYLFCHRAIIYHYIRMLDEIDGTKQNPRPLSKPIQDRSETQSGDSGSGRSIVTADSSGTSLPSIGTGFGSGSGSGSGTWTDLTTGSPLGDCGSASDNTTDIAVSSLNDSVAVDDESHAKRRASPTEIHPDVVLAVDEQTGLTKRPSFKKMKPALQGITKGSVRWKVDSEAIVDDKK